MRDEDFLRSEAERDLTYATVRLKELLWLGGLRLPTPREWPEIAFSAPPRFRVGDILQRQLPDGSFDPKEFVITSVPEKGQE